MRLIFLVYHSAARPINCAAVEWCAVIRLHQFLLSKDQILQVGDLVGS